MVAALYFQVTFEVPEKLMLTVETGDPPAGIAVEYGNTGWGGVLIVGWVP